MSPPGWTVFRLAKTYVRGPVNARRSPSGLRLHGVPFTVGFATIRIIAVNLTSYIS